MKHGRVLNTILTTTRQNTALRRNGRGGGGRGAEATFVARGHSQQARLSGTRMETAPS